MHVEARKKDMADGKFDQIGWNGVSRSAKLIVSVPTGSDLVVRTGDGSIRVDHVNGKVELRSGDGSVTGRDSSGDVVAHTEDGAIRLEGVDGKCDVASDDGSIAVQGRLEGLRVSTEDGSVVVRAAAGLKITRDWNLSTGDGSMVLYLADGLAADLDAEARDGSVKLDSGLVFAHESGDRSRGTVRGRLGAGGPRLVMCSGDGTIRLRRLPGGPPPSAPAPAASSRPAQSPRRTLIAPSDDSGVVRRRLRSGVLTTPEQYADDSGVVQDVQRGEAAAYAVLSSTPASANASRRSRHLLHCPQWIQAPPASTGLMHDSVRSSGTLQFETARDHRRLLPRHERRLDCDPVCQAER